MKGEMVHGPRTHLIVAVGSAPRLLLDTHSGSSRVVGISTGKRGRVSPSADLHAAVGYVVDLRLALSFVGMTRACSAGVVHGVVVVVYAGMSGELVGAREALLATREGALERLLPGMRADVTGLEGGRGEDKRTAYV